MASRAAPPLSRPRVLRMAMDLADTDGLTAVTMRRIAGELGVEAMSLYHHVPSKEALLDGLVEAVVADVEVALGEQGSAPADWQAALRQRCLTAREVMLAHPWAPGLIGSRTTIPPSLYSYFEEVLATLARGGFTYHLAHRALHSLGSMVLGFAQELLDIAPEEGAAEVDAEAMLAAMADTLPHLSAMVGAELHDHADDPLGWCDSQAEFEFTLDLLLDGLARHHAAS